MGKAEAVRTALTGTGQAVIAALLAPTCLCCREPLDDPLDGPVCARCWREVHLSDGRYEGALREIIHAFKYEGRRSLARPLGGLMRERGRRALEDAACAIPVPLFPWRRLRRGFNQAHDLAYHLGVPVVPALWRMRPTRAQTGLTAAERRRNVRGAFRLSPWLSGATRQRLIVDRIVVVVDDVLTTGATSEACTNVLLEAGAREVRVITLARA